MKKNLYLLLVMILTLATSCDEKVSTETLGAKLVRIGKWKVVQAQFGTEDAPSDMYRNFTITFKQNGSYSLQNPDGAVVINRDNKTEAGTWKEINPLTVLVDGKVNFASVGGIEGSNRLTFEWMVTIDGKGTFKYRWVLTPA